MKKCVQTQIAIAVLLASSAVLRVAEPAGNADNVAASESRPEQSAAANSTLTPPVLSPPSAFPRIVMAHAMLWGTPHSARFKPGFKPKDSPGYTGSGFYENAPLVPADTPDAGQDDRTHFPKAWFEDLKAAGIDAIDHCYFDGIPLSVLLDTANAARASGTGVRVLPTMDNMPASGPTFLKELWQNQALREHPNLLRIGDRVVVSTYGINNNSPDAWQKRLAAAEGGRFFVIQDVCQTMYPSQFRGIPMTEMGQLERARSAVDSPLINGMYSFTDLSRRECQSLSQLTRIGRSFAPPKTVGGCVVPGFVTTTRVATIIDCRGTRMLRDKWLEVIEQRADFVYVNTLNDYTEGTEVECSANSTFAFIDLNAYFGTRWRTGQWPVLAAPQAFLSYRKTLGMDEPVEVELVLLRPEIVGNESQEQIAKRFLATVTVILGGGRTVACEPVSPEVLPGHLAWRFRTRSGLSADGYATPAARLSIDGVDVAVGGGPAAPFVVVRHGEPLSGRWLHVPLHRVRSGVTARLIVAGETGNAYPRTIRVEGLPWDEVACGVLERAATSLSPALSPAQLREGFREEFFDGLGWCPMFYRDGKLKRNIIDQVDRYTAAIRMNDNTFVFPTPALLEPPRTISNEPFVDPATVQDFVIALGPKLDDLGWMRRELALPPEGDAHRPAIARDGEGPWYLRFDGVDDEIFSPWGDTAFMPPGPVTLELWLRPGDVTRARNVFDSAEPCLSLLLMPGGTLLLARWDPDGREVAIQGRTPLQPGRWHHVVAVFTGAAIGLYMDGQQDGDWVPVTGVRSDRTSVIGGRLPGLWDIASVSEKRGAARFLGDIGAFRVLQRCLAPEEIAARYDKQKDNRRAAEERRRENRDQHLKE